MDEDLKFIPDGPDGLNDELRVEFWKADWRYSLVGKAIIKENFEFYRVNAQWVKILGVPASEFFGKTFSDITTSEVREVDERQAQLVIEGKIDSYLLHKEYQFTDGSRKKVTLLVTRVPVDPTKPFEFFLSRILLRADPELETPSEPASSSQTWIESSGEFIATHYRWIIGLGLFVGAALIKLLGFA